MAATTYELIMRGLIVIAVAALGLGGCASFSDAFKATPPTVQLQLDSVPPGAEAHTSVGPGCKTPCSVSVTAPEGGFSVTYTLNKFQPATIPVQVIHVPGDLTTPASTTLDPNPAVVELQPATPPKPVRKRVKPKPKPVAPAAAASPFPNPVAPPPPAPSR